MTFIEAAIKVLKDNGNMPLSASEIWKIISNQNMFTSNGKTPWASLNAIMLMHMQNTRSARKGIVYFDGVGKPIKFKLIDGLVSNGAVPASTQIITLPVATVACPAVRVDHPIYQIVDESLGWKKLSVFSSTAGVEYVLEPCNLFTYVLNDPAGKIVKIGKTKNLPETRLSSLRTSNRAATYNHIFPSSLYDEASLHNKFSDIHHDGEWYYYAKKLQDFIATEKYKHTKVLASYKKHEENNNSERDMLFSLQ